MRDSKMKPCRFCLIPLTAFILFAICAPDAALATTRIVDSSASVCDSSATPTPCYRTISAALTAAVSGDTIEIHPGTYTGTYTITQQLTITGTETARTILSGNGSGPIITMSGATNVTIRKLSFTSSSTAVLAQSSSSVIINNCVFRVTGGTGIDVESSSTATINNNTFYNNANAIVFASGTSVTIINNIFSNNTGTAVSTTTTASSIQYNCFYGNTANGQTGDTTTNGTVLADPLFVSTSLGDFHLKTSSPCIKKGDPAIDSNRIDNGDPPDIGAYGGPNSDTAPYPVQSVAVSSVVSGATYTAQLTWSANNCYQVGGYIIYYSDVSSSYTTTVDAGNVATYSIGGLVPASTPTGAPVLTNSIASGTLLLNWNANAVSDATGYQIRYELDGATVANACPYATVPTVSSPSVDVGNTTSYNLTGLTNNTCYSVNSASYAQKTYYFVVTAYTTTNTHESVYSAETSTTIGDKQYGTASNVIHDYPEPITPMPNLPNGGGCFIATAAYGDYSAPQVRALREFRDRYLLTNVPGRVFVRWYYEYGSIAADFINAHPWLKPIVRAALLPAVGGAMVITETSETTKIVFVIVFGLFMLCAILKFRNYRSSLHPPRTLR
jgi:parallel beta-helix repeat protein